MGIFDNVSDVQGQLKAEGMNVVLTFQPGVPNAGQGTISWNIPGPVVESVDVNGNVTISTGATGTEIAYSGIVLVLRNRPVDHTNIPRDGKVYTGDPTANPQMFTGDRIGDGLVVGAFYESEIKAQGGTLTTSLVINDVETETPYYICGYICDDQLRYYTEGNRAYSDTNSSKPNELGSHAAQVISLGPNPVTGKFGVNLTDGTGLLAGAVYQFEVIYDSNYPHRHKKGERSHVRYMFIQIKGEDAPTFDALIKLINQQLAIKCTNAFQSPVPPGAGIYYWNATTQILYLWDGMQLNVVPNVVVGPTDPAMPAVGSYWWNTTNGQLYQWNGTSYVLVPDQMSYPVDPTKITGPNDYWYNTLTGIGYQRCGDTWCEMTLYSTTVDPSCPAAPVACSFWYDTTNQTLYSWANSEWNQTYAIMWPNAPNALPAGTYWYDLTNNLLYVYELKGPLATVTINSPGAGYTDGTYTNVPLTDVTGVGGGALATVVVAGGIITTVTVTTFGTGYVVGDALSASDSALGGVGVGFQCLVATLGVTAVLSWIPAGFISLTTDPFLQPDQDGVVAGTLWYNPTTEVLSQRDPTNTFWTVVPVLVQATDPTDVTSCELWWNDGVVPPVLSKWDVVNQTWDPATFFNQATDPYGTPTLVTGTLWYNPTANALLVWNGSSWSTTQDNEFITPFDPTNPPVGTAWLNTTTNMWYIWGTPIAAQWNLIAPVADGVDPSMPAQGSFWFDTTNNILYTRVGVMWVPVPYVTTPPSNFKGQTWYNLTTGQLMEWNGTMWVPIRPCVFCRLERGHIVFETTARGSNNVLLIPVPMGVINMASPCLTYGTGSADYWNDSNSPYANVPLGGPYTGYSVSNIGGLYDGNYGLEGFPSGGGWGGGPYTEGWWAECYCGFLAEPHGPIQYKAVPINPNSFLFAKLIPPGNVLLPQLAQDGVDGTPTTDIIGVGTNGSPDERRHIMSIVRTQLGYPTIQVELDDTQLDRSVQNALNVFRQRSSMAYKRAAFFLDIQPFKQNYILANKAVGFNKIVSVMAGYRFTSAFLSSAMGAGVYGQIVLQHLYNMGTFDLLSYHLVSNYVEQLEILFSTRLVFVFDEASRELQIFQAFNRPERVLLDVTIERTEQEIFRDRYSKRWIQRYAQAEAMDMLAQIRGKFANLPGAGGSVTLNAADLRTGAQDIRTELLQELDDLIVQDVEDYGAYGSIAIG